MLVVSILAIKGASERARARARSRSPRRERDSPPPSSISTPRQPLPPGPTARSGHPRRHRRAGPATQARPRSSPVRRREGSLHRHGTSRKRGRAQCRARRPPHRHTDHAVSGRSGRDPPVDRSRAARGQAHARADHQGDRSLQAHRRGARSDHGARHCLCPCRAAPAARPRARAHPRTHRPGVRAPGKAAAEIAALWQWIRSEGGHALGEEH